MVSVDEQTLISRCLQGDTEAFRLLYERHHQRVFQLCWRISGDRHAAEDLCQDVFLRAYKHLPRFQLQSSFATWLHRIALNRALNYCRKRKNRFVSWDAVTLSKGNRAIAISQEPQPDDKLEQDETARLLWQTLQELPEKYRTVLILQKFEERSVKEIAELLKETPSSVESRLYRAKVLLAKKLTPLLKKNE